MACPICGREIDWDSGIYPNLVYKRCSRRAVNENGDGPWYGWPPGEEPEREGDAIPMPPDDGENPVFIDGQKYWRRYRFGGSVTMMDEHNCDSLNEFYEKHGVL